MRRLANEPVEPVMEAVMEAVMDAVMDVLKRLLLLPFLKDVNIRRHVIMTCHSIFAKTVFRAGNVIWITK